jgi:hypothetical protein
VSGSDGIGSSSGATGGDLDAAPAPKPPGWSLRFSDSGGALSSGARALAAGEEAEAAPLPAMLSSMAGDAGGEAREPAEPGPSLLAEKPTGGGSDPFRPRACVQVCSSSQHEHTLRRQPTPLRNGADQYLGHACTEAQSAEK